jgi:hypothetical protein
MKLDHNVSDAPTSRVKEAIATAAADLAQDVGHHRGQVHAIVRYDISVGRKRHGPTGLAGLGLEGLGRFLQFAAEDPHVAGSLDSERDAITSNAPHLDRDIVSDVNLLTNFSAEYEHPYFS